MKQTEAKLIRTEQLAATIFRLTFEAPEIAMAARPGQFVMLSATSGLDPLLRRPFSIHQVSGGVDLQVLFKVLGKGTSYLSRLKPGDHTSIVGPLGKGFELGDSASICLVGGGMGIAPLLFLAKYIIGRNKAVRLKILLGAMNKDEIKGMAADFESLAIDLELATDDGSMGHHGFVTELLVPALVGIDAAAAWQVLCCGPQPMMQVVAGVCERQGWQCQVSMETLMACGISACLGCTIDSTKKNDKGGTYLHVCKDGPVFQASDIKWIK